MSNNGSNTSNAGGPSSMSNASRGTRVVSAGDWVRMKRLLGARNNGYSSDGYLDPASPNFNKDVIPITSLQNPYSLPIHVFPVGGNSKIRRPASNWIDNVGFRYGDIVLSSQQGVNQSGSLIEAQRFCNCTKTNLANKDVVCRKCLTGKPQGQQQVPGYPQQGGGGGIRLRCDDRVTLDSPQTLSFTNSNGFSVELTYQINEEELPTTVTVAPGETVGPFENVISYRVSCPGVAFVNCESSGSYEGPTTVTFVGDQFIGSVIFIVTYQDTTTETISLTYGQTATRNNVVSYAANCIVPPTPGPESLTVNGGDQNMSVAGEYCLLESPISYVNGASSLTLSFTALTNFQYVTSILVQSAGYDFGPATVTSSPPGVIGPVTFVSGQLTIPLLATPNITNTYTITFPTLTPLLNLNDVCVVSSGAPPTPYNITTSNFSRPAAGSPTSSDAQAGVPINVLSNSITAFRLTVPTTSGPTPPYTFLNYVTSIVITVSDSTGATANNLISGFSPAGALTLTGVGTSTLTVTPVTSTALPVSAAVGFELSLLNAATISAITVNLV